MKKLTFVDVEKHEFENIDINIDNVFGTLGRSRIGERTRTMDSVLASRHEFLKKTRILCHDVLIEHSVLHGFEINICFKNAFKIDSFYRF